MTSVTKSTRSKRKHPNSVKDSQTDPFPKEIPTVIALLKKDHSAMRRMMSRIQSSKATPKQVMTCFEELKALVYSHVAAEEKSLIDHLKEHPRFEHEALESYEEHRVHEVIFAGISKLRNQERKVAQMKIYCEMLEHHLKEEETDLFPRYKKHFAHSTRKKAGKVFLKERLATKPKDQNIGAAAHSVKIETGADAA